MGAHGVLRQGWQLGGQRWRGKKGEGRSWPPSSQPTGPPSRSWASGLGLPCGGGERDAFQVSGGGDVMWGGAQVRDTRLGFSPLLSPFPVLLFYCLPSSSPALPPSSPLPQQWKKPVIHAAVGGQLFTSEDSWFYRVFVHFICTPLRPPYFVPLAFLSPLLPVSVGETATPAGPNTYVYHSFRAINLTI